MAKTAKNSNIIWRTLHRLAQADIIFYLMPFLIFVLVLGTIEQASIGLYDSNHKYFSSLFFWLGYIPFPGGYLLLGIMSLSLLIKFLFFSDWKLQKSGIILTHLGALILLLGGLMTAISQREYYMVLPEGGSTPYIYDYFETETLAFNGKERIALANLPFTFDILERCDNCDIKKREEIGNPYDLPLHGMAQFMALLPKPREPQAEANLSGITAKITSAGDEQDGIYVAFQHMPKPIEVKKGNKTYSLIYGKKQSALPFQIALKDFKKTTHPGTMMASAYSSDITLIDGDIEWNARIEMNEPLRYKGYTFYQSSFEQTPDEELSILSVVENKGRLFPYIGTLVIALGLITHLLLAVRRKKGGTKS